MPPKKILKSGPGQLKLNFIKLKENKTDAQGHSDTETDEKGTAATDNGSRKSSEPPNSEITENSVSTLASKRTFQDKWSKVWPWLYEAKDKMYCNLCLEGGKQNTFTQGCTTYRTSSMTRHEETADHISCIQSKTLKKDMSVALKRSHEAHDTALIKAMKCVHWLVSENLPLSKYESFVHLLKDLEVPGLEGLAVSSRLSYESYYTATELLEAMSATVDDKINAKLADSPFIAILADESTDISNTQRMTITALVIDPLTSQPNTLFIQDLEYEDGSGAGLTSEILKQLEQRNLPYHKIIGLGTDGASVMTGQGKGVFGRMKEVNPHIVNIHCMAHRLALCTSQAANTIPMLKKYQEWLTQLFYYFKHSALREKQLHKIQEILDHPTLKYREIHAVRWLSFFEALQAVYRTIDPLLTYLHGRDRSKDARAKGILKYMATRQFLFITYLMMDIIPIVSKLSLTLQSDSLDVAKAKIAIDLCLADLDSYKHGTQQFKTHLEEFEAMEKIDGHYEFNGHRLTDGNTNFAALKSRFVNSLVQNITDRFPKKSLIDAFCVIAMRTINFEDDIIQYGIQEIDFLLKHYGEEKVHNGKISAPLLDKQAVKAQWNEAKLIVRAAKYPVDDMKNLWQLLTTHHRDQLQEIVKLAQIALVLPLHTAGCERVFSQQNLIVTKQRNRLSPELCDKLLRVKLWGKVNFDEALDKYHKLKSRKGKQN